MRLTLVGQNLRAHIQLSEKKSKAATPRPLPNRAQVQLPKGQPASGHRSPLLESELADSERNPDELAAIASKAHLEHVELPFNHSAAL